MLYNNNDNKHLLLKKWGGISLALPLAFIGGVKTASYLTANSNILIVHADAVNNNQIEKHTSTIKPDNQAQKDQALNDAQAAGVNVIKDNSTTYNADDDNIDDIKRQAEQDYQKQIDKANQVENDYNNSVFKYNQDLAKYNQDKADNEAKNKAIDGENAKADADFQKQKQDIDNKNKEIDAQNKLAQDDYQKAVERYNKDLADYQNKKINGDTIMSANDVSQHLVMGRESTAQMDIKVNNADWTLNGSNVTANKLQSYSGSIADVTYSNLKNTYYTAPDGSKHNISKMVFKYSNVVAAADTTSYSQLTLKFCADPTDTLWYVGPISLDLDIYYYDENGNLITASDKNPFFITLSSLNSNGGDYAEKAKARNGKVYQLKNSSVTVHDDGWLYSDINNNGMKIDKNGVPYPGEGLSGQDAWDSTTANKENDSRRWYGAGVAEVQNADHVALSFGVSRPGSVWAKVNTTIPSTQFDMGKPTPPTLIQHEKEPVQNAHKPHIPFNEQAPTKPTVPTIYNHDIVINYTSYNYPATITYIDDNTGKTLKVESTNGKANTNIAFPSNVQTEINTFEAQGYKLVSNNFSGQKFSKDQSKNSFVVRLNHNQTLKTRTIKVNRTINYLDKKTNNPVAKQVIQTTTFTQHGTEDAVTHQITWQPITGQSFKEVDSPTVSGYNSPDKVKVDGETVTVNDQNSVVNVYYDKVAPKTPKLVINENQGHKVTPTTPTDKPTSKVTTPADNKGTTPAKQAPATQQDNSKISINKVANTPAATPANTTLSLAGSPNSLAQTNANNKQNGAMLLALTGGMLTLGLATLNKKHD